MHRPFFKKHAWYVAPILGVLIWLLIRTIPEFNVDNATWVICEDGAEKAELDIWFGEHQPWMDDVVDDLGYAGVISTLTK